MIGILIYLGVGAYCANGCEYSDGSKGLGSPLRFVLMALIWPVLVWMLLMDGKRVKPSRPVLEPCEFSEWHPSFDVDTRFCECKGCAANRSRK